MGIFRLIYILISLCYVVHSPVMSQSFEDCKDDPSCESDYCTKYPTDPSCGSSMTFPDCGGDPGCNAHYTDSCDKDPNQDICKTATTTSSTSSGEFEACKGDTDCNEACTKDPSDPMCGSTSSTDSTTSTSESSGGFDACKGDPVCNETCTKNPSDPMCGSTDSTTSTDSGTTPIMEITSPSEDTYTYDPNVFNPPSTIDECKGDTMCEKDYCVSSPSDPSCSSYYPSPDGSLDSLYDGMDPITVNPYPMDSIGSLDGSSLIGDGSDTEYFIPDIDGGYDIAIGDGSDTEYFIPDIDGGYDIAIGDGTDTVVAIGSESGGSDSIIGSGSAFYSPPGSNSAPETTLEDLYGPLNSDIATGEDATHRHPAKIFYYYDDLNDEISNFPGSILYADNLSKIADVSTSSDIYLDSDDVPGTITSLETITSDGFWVGNCDDKPGDYDGEAHKDLTTCYFNAYNYKNYNSEAPIYFKPNYPAKYYKIPLGVISNQSTYDPDKLFTPYIHTVQGSGHVSRLRFRTRERLFKFGNRLTQSNLSESDIVKETKIEQEYRIKEQINKTRDTLWIQHENYVKTTEDIKQKILNLMTRLSEIENLLKTLENGDNDLTDYYHDKYNFSSDFDTSKRSTFNYLEERPIDPNTFLYVGSYFNSHLWGDYMGYGNLFKVINHETMLNHQKAFFADKMLQTKKLLLLKGKVESEIDILQEEYNRVSRKFRYDLTN